MSLVSGDHETNELKEKQDDSEVNAGFILLLSEKQAHELWREDGEDYRNTTHCEQRLMREDWSWGNP